MIDVPELALTDPDLLRDPFTGYGRARERAPLVRLVAPGFGPMWAFTRHEGARAMLTDPRFALSPDSYAMRPKDLPEDCLPYLRTMQEMEGPEHARLRRLVAPAFTARRAAEFRPRIDAIVAGLLDALAADEPADGPVDLLGGLARPLPIAMICELVGIPARDRPDWQRHGAAVAAGRGAELAAAIPAIIAGARAAVAARRAEPADDLISELIRVQDEDGGRLSDTELVTLVWQLVLAGQTPINLIANAVVTLVDHPDQLAALRADPALLPGAVDELMRWCGPQLLTIPRQATEDVVIEGTRIGRGEPVTVAIAAANRDPRVFADADRLNVCRTGMTGHLGFGHGPHFCLGAGLARVLTEAALAEVLRRFPNLAVAHQERMLDPGTWRLTALTVTG